MNHDKKTQEPPKVNAPTDKEYVEIIKSDTHPEKKYIEGEGEATKIIYYCRECKAPVTPKRIEKRLSFTCGQCGKHVSFGTEESIHNYYNVKQKQS